MPVKAARELFPREFQNSPGSFTANRTFIVLVTGNTSAEQIIQFIGIADGDRHPEYGDLKASGKSITRNGDDSVTVQYTYDDTEEDVNPVFKPAKWTFSSGGATEPTLFYFFGEGNGDVRPLTNAVGEYVWENITHPAAEVRANLSKNFLTRPTSWLGMSGKINEGGFLWGGQYQWLCAGVNASEETQKIGSKSQKYWKASVELVYRQSGYVYRLPHVGWGFINTLNNQYQRFRVKRDNGLTDSPSPLPLTEAGNNKYDVLAGQSGPPDYILRRVHESASFGIFNV